MAERPGAYRWDGVVQSRERRVLALSFSSQYTRLVQRACAYTQTFEHNIGLASASRLHEEGIVPSIFASPNDLVGRCGTAATTTYRGDDGIFWIDADDFCDVRIKIHTGLLYAQFGKRSKVQALRQYTDSFGRTSHHRSHPLRISAHALASVGLDRWSFVRCCWCSDKSMVLRPALVD